MAVADHYHVVANVQPVRVRTYFSNTAAIERATEYARRFDTQVSLGPCPLDLDHCPHTAIQLCARP